MTSECIECSLHPSKPAHFQCNECSSAFCSECIVQRQDFQNGQMETNYICPFCNIPADPVGVGNLLEPFWTRMPKFFTYPLQTTPLILAVVLSLLAIIFPHSLIVWLICFIVSTKYAYAILTHTAQGRLTPPSASTELFNSDVSQVFKQYVIFALFFFIFSLLFGWIGIICGGLFALVSFLMMPGMLMMLVTTNSILVAINPFVVIPVISRIGGRYFLMLVFLILLPAGPAALLYYVPAALPAVITLFLTALLKHYYTFISYNLMGYVLLQYHEEIGYDVDYDDFIESTQPGKKKKKITPEQARLHHIDILIKGGRHEAALEMVREELSDNREDVKDDVTLSEKYYDLLKVCQKRQGIIKHGPEHLRLLISSNNKLKAIKVYEELAADKEIIIPIESGLAVGKWLYKRGDYKRARVCFTRCIKENPKHAKLPEAYYPIIRLFNEHFNNPAQARKIGKGVLRTYPKHPLAEKVQQYLKTIG